ncbi:MAG: transposase [Vicinamibacteria bacterium]|nr:transposase [Vicinamibacteria bacterium]
MNTSFIERLNLTIRQGSAYLRRRSTSHARYENQLREHVEPFRCHYNFVRPHRALRFGHETRTPATQAGLVSQPLTWSDIFTADDLLAPRAKKGCLINSEWRKHRRPAAQGAPSSQHPRWTWIQAHEQVECRCGRSVDLLDVRAPRIVVGSAGEQ